MNINRNNYEGFFLLYVDGELSAAEKKVVESYVSENPDLEQEFFLLQQTRLIPDHTVFFENRESLLKSAEDESAIAHHNYEEFFLLYADNELDEKNKKAVEKFVADNPELQKELTLLQKAHLEPDNNVLFEGKTALYKSEDKKTVRLPWLRIAVAAAIVLLIAGFLVFKYTLTKPTQSVAVNKINTDSKNAEKKQLPVTSLSPDTLHNTNAMDKIASTQNKDQDSNMDKDQKNKIKTGNGNMAINEPDVKGMPAKAGGNMAVAAINEDAENKINTSTIAVQSNADIDIAAVKSNTPDIKEQSKASDTNLIARQIVFNGQDPNPEDVSLMTFSPKKSTMRGVFRRITRVFEKTTNADDNKRNVLVGNFQIALK